MRHTQMGCFQSTLSHSSVVKLTKKPLDEIQYSNPTKTNVNFKSTKIHKNGVHS